MSARAGLAALLLAAWAPPAVAAAHSPAHLDYLLQCQGCHLADGRGAPEKGVPALRGSVARFLTVEGGRAYLIRVPGASGSPLSDAELAAVLNWIVQTFGPAEAARAAAPFTEQEVRRFRRPPLDDVAPVRNRLLDKIR